jgi:sodium transport system permease protein
MRWSIIRLIWARELRDQLRDRRTLFMIAVLPVLLYPVAGFGVMQLAVGFLNKPSTIGVVGAEYLPTCPPRDDAIILASTVGQAASLPSTPLVLAERTAAMAALNLPLTYPALFYRDGNQLRFYGNYLEPDQSADLFQVRTFAAPTESGPPSSFPDRVDLQPLKDRQVDLMLIVSPQFSEQLAASGRPVLWIRCRSSDERSRLVDNRVTGILRHWKESLKKARLVRQGLPANFDDPFEIDDPEKSKPVGKRAAEDLFEMLIRIFPFVLVMWSLAGALYPAVDLCAGEKERGTMETLLISPASREEIVWGKFLTIWVFSAATALLNLLSMGWTTWQFSRLMPSGVFRPGPLLWGVALLLPLSAFFSALCLAVGAYARSSKEGQYYLMPLFLVTMPLIFLTLAPGVELSPFYSMVPVTGVALLLQRLMAADQPGPDLWGYFPFVLAPMVLYGWLALRWAIEQFQREEVLFREAERLDIRLWLRRLFRDKEALPSSGEAFFCFGLIIGLQWVCMGLAGHVSPDSDLPGFLNLYAVRSLAFVAAPALFMALLLTTRPWSGLALRLPPWWAWPTAPVLAFLLLPPVAVLIAALLEQFPDLKRSLLEFGGAAREGTARQLGQFPGLRWQTVVVLGVLPAVGEELAFRGFILSGLRRRFRPGTALLLSSFLFALYQMNVFQFAPHFLLGLVMGVLTMRTGSIFPAMVFHLTWNLFTLGPVFYPETLEPLTTLVPADNGLSLTDVLLGCAGILLAAPLLVLLWYRGKAPTSEQQPAATPMTSGRDGVAASISQESSSERTWPSPTTGIGRP